MIKHEINGHSVTCTTKIDRMGSMYFKWECDCKGFQFRHTCKHINQVIDDSANSSDIDDQIIERFE